MASNLIQPSFAGGEYAPELYSRVDLSRYSIGLRRCRNFIISPQGGASNRSGTYMVAETKDSTSRSRIVKFIFNDSQAYTIEFGDQYIRFYTDHEQITNSGTPYEVASPYLENDLRLLKFESSADVIYITHPDYQTMTLTRFGNADWELDNYVSDDGPFMPVNTDESLSINASAVTGEGITLTASSVSTNVKALLHFDGDDTSITFTEDTNKTVTNNTVNDSDTKLLLHCDGLNNGTTFTDEMSKAISRTGSAVTKTDTKKFGSASLYLDGSSSIYAGDSADWAFAGDFTVECWINPLTISNYRVIWSQTNNSTTRCLAFIMADGSIKWWLDSSGRQVDLTTSGITLTTGTWYHLAFVRSSNTWSIYVNGISRASSTYSGAYPNLTGNFIIGYQVDNYYFHGNVDEFRVSHVARWTDTFTPPSYQYGYVKTVVAQSKFGGSSAYFDGASFLSMADSADFFLDTDDFTIDFWIKPETVSDCILYSQYENVNNQVFIQSSGTTLNFSAITGGVKALEFNIPFIPSGEWQHIMITRSSDVWHGFIDGDEKAKTLTAGAYNASIPNINGLVRIGCLEGTSGFFNGWMDEFRLINGEAEETTTFSTASTAYVLPGVFYPSHEGALFKLRHYVGGQAVYSSFSGTGTSASIKCFTTWRIITHGTWTGTLKIEKSDDGGATWTTLRTYSSANDSNINTYGTEDIESNTEPFLIRLNMSSYTSGTCNSDLTSDPFYQEGIVRVTDFISGTQVNADVIQDIASTDETSSWYEGSWSDYRGWPSVSRFIQDRLAFSSTYSEPMTTWMTQIGNYNSFSRHNTLIDSDAISVNLPSRQLNAINGLVALRKLIALTSSSEWTIGAVSGSALTPTTTEQLVQGYRGSYGIEPELIGNECIFCQANGMVIRNLSYQFSSDAFVGSDLNILARHLFKNHTVVEMAYQQDPNSVLWCLRDDGILLALTYMAEQEVIAWSWHDTEGEVESICCIPADGYDELWMIVNRENGRFVEYMAPRMFAGVDGEVDLAEQNFLDSSVKFTEGQSISVPHLAGQMVNILEDGIPLGEESANASGVVSLTVSSATVIVGLPYVSQIETLNIEAPTKYGTVQGSKVKVGSVTFRVVDTIGGWVGSDEDSLYEAFPDAIAAEGVTLPTALYSGDIKMPLGGSYDDGGRVFYEQRDPSPVTISCVIPNLTVGG